MYSTPKKFLLVALNNAETGPRMVAHLVRSMAYLDDPSCLTDVDQNDHFHISHFYQTVDEVAQDQMYNLDNGSTGSVVRSRPATPGFMRSTSYRSYLKPLISRAVRKCSVSLTTSTKLVP
jgi:hypothetical protein